MNYLQIAKELDQAELEAVVENAIETGVIAQCERCMQWLCSDEIRLNMCQHCYGDMTGKSF